ncbi:histidine kinase [Micromonospora costi]|uniref:sensor histidine kinase n=1 Tax=Micromonospora costi TaxID=1530042 RepID=UPI0033DDEC6B
MGRLRLLDDAAPSRRRRPGWRESVGDAALALVLLAFGLAGTAPSAAQRGVDADARAYALVVAAALALAVRRRWPFATLAVVAVTTTAYLLLYPYGPILVSFFVAVYTVAVHRPLRPAAVGGAVALALLTVHVFAGARPPGLLGLMPAAAWVVVPFAVGTTVRLTREATARNRAEEARQLADGERLRVAQEVHDVVGHGLAAIHMQAEIALHLLEKRPEQAETALAAISRTSKEALDELRVTLAVVRRGDGTAERAPAPGLAQVPVLRDRLAGTGLPVTVDVDGEPVTLPVAVDLAAYRVVQESLTNVLRHAGPATAAVRIRYTPTEVDVEVTDTGCGAAVPGGGGSGLAGMRERITALGGSFDAGPAEGGGFRVYARLPVEERP